MSTYASGAVIHHMRKGGALDGVSLLLSCLRSASNTPSNPEIATLIQATSIRE